MAWHDDSALHTDPHELELMGSLCEGVSSFVGARESDPSDRFDSLPEGPNGLGLLEIAVLNPDAESRPPLMKSSDP